METILLLITALGVVAAFYQLRQQTKIQRAALVKDTWDMFDSDILDAFYRVDSVDSKFLWKESFPDTEEAKGLDLLIAYCDSLCYLKQNKVIGKRDWPFFAHTVETVVRDECSRKCWQHWNTQAQKIPLAPPYPFIDEYYQENYKTLNEF